MKPATEIARILRSLRWRMVIGDFLRDTVRAALFFLAGLVLLTAATWWRGAFRPEPVQFPLVLAWPLVLGAVAGLVIALVRFPGLARVAQVVDRAGATKDRLVTALSFSKRSGASELECLAVAEITGYARGRDLRPFLPIRLPRETPWLAVPVAMLALLWWDAMGAAATRDQRATEETAAIAGTAAQLDRLASQFDKNPDSAKEQELRRIAERLKQSAEQMRAEAASGGDAQKAALRELAMLEELVRQLRQPEAATPEELKALAAAMMKHEQTREAGKDIQGGNLAGAAKKLEDAAARPDEPSADEVGRELKQAIDHLAQQREQASRQIEKLQREAAQGGRGEVLKQIANLLNELQPQSQTATKGAGGKGAGKRMTDDDLKKLLGALQDLKNQQQGGGAGGAEPRDGEPGSEGPIAMLDFGQRGNAAGDPGDALNTPTGMPGTDADKGTSGDPFGKKGDDARDAARKEQLSGRLAEGETLSALIPSAAAGDEKAARRYKELYEAAAGYAEDAVTQEELPLGARFLIKRYFEAIRPKQ